MAFTEGFVVFVLAAAIALYVRQHYGEVEYVRSDVDGRRYLVRKLPDRQRAADELARLNADMQRLARHVKAKYGSSEAEGAGGSARARAASRLFDNYDPDALSEGGMEIGYTSYSVNKGEKIVLCLRQRDNTLVDHNVMVYVAVHELGHLASETVGHTDEFWSTFRWLLEEAMDMGLYRKVDYARQPVKYCGVTIASSVV